MKHLWLIVFLVAVEVWKTESQYPGRRWQSARSNEGYLSDLAEHKRSNQKCGQRFLDKKVQAKRIVGGEESVQGSWPWQVAVFIYGFQICGGSLINNMWVVTAGHCLATTQVLSGRRGLLTVKLGEHKLGEVEKYEQTRKVDMIILHPDYVFKIDENGTLLYIDSDVALLKLSSPVEFDDFISPICLLNDKITFKPGKECYVTGWGRTQFEGFPAEALREAKVKLVSRKVCNRKKSYGGRIHNVALCAGFEEGGVDSCSGDSGGPLSCERDGRFYLTGVVSWGFECARPHKYGVYANMMKLTSWVRKTTGTENWSG